MMKGYRDLSQLVTLSGLADKDGRHPKESDLSIIESGAVIWDKDQILWTGKSEAIPAKYSNIQWKSLPNHTLTPEVVDSHTHLVFGGNRAEEYSMRLAGADYQQIAKAGGGILHTMQATNTASRDQLFTSASSRIERIASYGVGTIEIKSGYGLNLEKEIECTEIINDLKEQFAGRVNIFNTFMAAHAIPKEFSSADKYLEEVVFKGLEYLAEKNIIDAADIFHEIGYFDSVATEKFFKFCQDLSIPIKSHADEFNDNKGAILAANYNALSTDHLLKTGPDGIDALSKSSTVATILPGTGFFLGKPQADARSIIDAGAKLSLASDYNPGSCHCDNILLIAALSAPSLKLSLSEIWSAITHNASHALGLKEQGAIVIGRKPRFSLFKVSQIDEITYSWGRNFSIKA